MSIVIDGVTLPDIPEGFFDTYPYGLIYRFDEDSYSLLAAAAPFVYYNKETAGSEYDGYMQGVSAAGYKRASYNTETSTEWEIEEENATGSVGVEMGFNGTDGTIVWSNHDVMTLTGMNDDGSMIYGEIYFPSSVVAEPEYGKIRRQIMRGIANAIRRKTGGTDKIPPEQMESEIDSIVTADGLPVADDYAFGGSATEYGMGAAASVFTNKVNSQLTAANAFRPVTDVEVVGLRFADLTTGSYWLYLWDIAGNVLAQSSAWIKGNATKEWVEESISPVTLTAGNQYVVGIYCNSNNYHANKSAIQSTSKIAYYKNSASSGKGTFSSDLETGTSSNLYACDIIIGASADLPETYQISLDTINGLAAAVQNATGSKSSMRIDEMISALQNVTTATAEE